MFGQAKNQGFVNPATTEAGANRIGGIDLLASGSTVEASECCDDRMRVRAVCLSKYLVDACAGSVAMIGTRSQAAA
jgi:hypothetical protein